MTAGNDNAAWVLVMVVVKIVAVGVVVVVRHSLTLSVQVQIYLKRTLVFVESKRKLPWVVLGVFPHGKSREI